MELMNFLHLELENKLEDCLCDDYLSEDYLYFAGGFFSPTATKQ